MNRHEGAPHIEAHDGLHKLFTEVGNILVRLVGIEDKLNAAIANFGHRLVVLEGQMENVRARLEGHDLAFVTMTLDEEGRADLARTIGLGQKERTIEPEEGGTSRS